MAAIRYKIDDTILLFIKCPPNGTNYITQKEKLPLGNVIKLRNDEPSRYYCLDGIFI